MIPKANNLKITPEKEEEKRNEVGRDVSVEHDKADG